MRLRPYEITEVRKQEDGQLNVFVRENRASRDYGGCAMTSGTKLVRKGSKHQSAPGRGLTQIST